MQYMQKYLKNTHRTNIVWLCIVIFLIARAICDCYLEVIVNLMAAYYFFYIAYISASNKICECYIEVFVLLIHYFKIVDLEYV